jgi:hypothetical protein
LKESSSVDWSTQVTVMLVLEAAVAVAPLGATGAMTPVVALAVLE